MIMKNNEYANRMGILHIDFRLFEDYPELVKEIMSHMLIVRAEMKDFGGSVEYHAYSKKFEPIDNKDTTLVPSYIADVCLREGKIVDFKIVKMEK